MWECEQALEWISARIDGCLTSEEEARLDAHLAHCPACQSLLADLELIHSDLEKMAAAPAPVPPALRDDIVDQIRATRPGHRAAPPHWRTWAAAAAVLAVVLLGAGPLQIWRNGGSGATTANLAADVGSSGGAAPEAETGGTGDTGADPQPTPSSASDGGDEASKEAVNSPASPDGAASSEETAGGEPSYTAAPTPPPSTSTYQSQTTSPPADGSQPETGDTGAGAQPRSETADANGQPQGYAATTAPTPGPDAVTLTGMPIYRGVLTLTWAQAEGLSALEGLSYTAQGDTRSYLLPAADFEALVQTLNAAGTDALRQSGGDISPDADQGLVLVTGAPAQEG